MPIEIPDHTNDAINLALMRRHHIKNIATNDPDFGQVADLVVWKPVPISSS